MSFREQTSLTVEQLSDGIRCYTVRPIVSQRLWLRVLLASICGSTALTGLLPSLLSVSALIAALFMAGRAVFSVELESLLIMEGIGLQLTTRYATGHEKVRFVETSAVSEVLRTPGDAASASHSPLPLLWIARSSSTRQCGLTGASFTWPACCTATTRATSRGASLGRAWPRARV